MESWSDNTEWLKLYKRQSSLLCWGECSPCLTFTSSLLIKAEDNFPTREHESISSPMWPKWPIQRFLVFYLLQCRSWESVSKTIYVFFQLWVRLHPGNGHSRQLSKPKPGDQQVTALKRRYTKRIKAMMVTTEPSRNTTANLVCNWVILYGIPTYRLTGNGQQFESRIFMGLTLRLSIKPLLNISCHTQFHDQLERFNSTTEVRLWHYFAKHQTECD